MTIHYDSWLCCLFACHFSVEGSTPFTDCCSCLHFRISAFFNVPRSLTVSPKSRSLFSAPVLTFLPDKLFCWEGESSSTHSGWPCCWEEWPGWFYSFTVPLSTRQQKENSMRFKTILGGGRVDFISCFLFNWFFISCVSTWLAFILPLITLTFFT